MFSILKRNFAIATVALVVVGGGAIAAAQDAPPRSQVTAQQPETPQADAPNEAPQPDARVEAPQPDARRKHHRRGPEMGILGHAVHGQLIVRTKDGAFEEVTFDRGTLTSVEGDTLTITRPDDKTVKVTVNDATKFHGAANTGELKTGRPIMVVSKDGVATRVGQPTGDGPPRRPAAGATAVQNV